MGMERGAGCMETQAFDSSIVHQGSCGAIRKIRETVKHQSNHEGQIRFLDLQGLRY